MKKSVKTYIQNRTDEKRWKASRIEEESFWSWYYSVAKNEGYIHEDIPDHK